MTHYEYLVTSWRRLNESLMEVLPDRNRVDAMVWLVLQELSDRVESGSEEQTFSAQALSAQALVDVQNVLRDECGTSRRAFEGALGRLGQRHLACCLAETPTNAEEPFIWLRPDPAQVGTPEAS